MPDKILVIEDDLDILRLLEARLKISGYNVITARNGKEGLKKVGQKAPDLVILDLMLPDIRGEDICKEIRETKNKVPIIMLTAKDLAQDKAYGKTVGANSYFTKPFNPYNLLLEIDKLLIAKKGKKQR